jgi:hypothetical protein
MKKRSHERAQDKRTITISIDKEIVAELDTLAKKENRTRSNWIVTELKKIVGEKMTGKKITILPGATSAQNASRLMQPQGDPRLNETSSSTGPHPRSTKPGMQKIVGGKE